MQHIIAYLPGNGGEVLLNIGIGLEINTLKSRDVLNQRHLTVLNSYVALGSCVRKEGKLPPSLEASSHGPSRPRWS